MNDVLRLPVNPVNPVSPYPDDPYPTAARLRQDGLLKGWTERDGTYYQWTDRAYERRTQKQLRNYLGGLLADESITGGVKWKPNRAKLSNVIDAIKLDDIPDPDRHLLALENGLYDVATDTLTASTPDLFVTNYLPYRFDPDAECPEWDRFLESIWPDDSEAVALLQEWFGYLVSGSTAHQKALLMIGPKRSGKGTIMRIAESLLGQENTGAIRMSNLTSWFGTQTLLGKSLAIIGDLRIDGRLRAAAVETLLSITGEDLINVQLKGMGNEPLDVRLRCRIMAATNAPPIFRDVSGVLPTRFLYLVFAKSFYGSEDIDLSARLATELPGILNWAMEGWRSLEACGWTTPRSSSEVAATAESDASAVGQFLSECCEKTGSIPTQALFARWQGWAKARGFPSGDTSAFGSELKSQWPHVQKTQRRVSGKRCSVYVGVDAVDGVTG
ncbi:hypothetical protein BST36_20820 [Mycolicibacterium moriokaense]|uniref:SF3 helicase domain-containing protein n=1 Tax=Mycolicibacterium moriokaense TaxID=39691 RepID=A0AAD1HC23_9MYCO|nr:phage/plasmid primase, P4 family [Mycolicibacterium moriokaense]MCV7039683.1 hypothetical protein [Mycolicibacterium moriokaense]ORB19870.1 hypothetical protein BST36_20820 [Mycolicibacterium moriokaense]BBX01869.1 hypothetical protein MMOR_28050 [Mycolicibacterium moriokaense]